MNKMKSSVKIIALILFSCAGCGDNDSSTLDKFRNPSNLSEFYDSITYGDIADINSGYYDSEEMPCLLTCSYDELTNAVMKSFESVNKVRSICDKLLDSSKMLNGSEMDRARIVYVISRAIKSKEARHEKNKNRIQLFNFLRKYGITMKMAEDWFMNEYPLFFDMEKQFEFEYMLRECGMDDISLITSP